MQDDAGIKEHQMQGLHRDYIPLFPTKNSISDSFGMLTFWRAFPKTEEPTVQPSATRACVTE